MGFVFRFFFRDALENVCAFRRSFNFSLPANSEVLKFFLCDLSFPCVFVEKLILTSESFFLSFFFEISSLFLKTTC